MSGQERNLSIDLLRILCCLMVIAIHATPEYPSYVNQGASSVDEAIGLLIQSFVRVGLPVFFMISGMYILNSETGDLVGFYKKRLLRVTIPFLVYGCLHFFILGYRDPSATFWSLSWGFLSGLRSPAVIGPHFWFVYSIVGLYLISPLVAAVLRGVDSTQAGMAIFILLAIKAYNTYSVVHVVGIPIPDINVWLLYFVIGGLIVKVRLPSATVSITAILLSWLLTCVAEYMRIRHPGSVDLRPFDCGLNMYLFAISICLLFLALKVRLPAKTERIFLFVSKTTYSVFLIHVLVLFEIGARVNLEQFRDNLIAYAVEITLFVFTVSFVLATVIDYLVCDRLLQFFARKRVRLSFARSLSGLHENRLVE